MVSFFTICSFHSDYSLYLLFLWIWFSWIEIYRLDHEFKLPFLVGWLQSLNARTGLFSKRMKIIHRDPMLHAQRVAAIKKTKGTAAARKHASEAMKAFFSDPENRRKRGVSMKGVKFYCRNCGQEGHRRYYCPELQDSLMDRGFKCRLCGEKGHNRRTCPKSKPTQSQAKVPRHHCCRICGQSGHNCKTCPQATQGKSYDAPKSRTYTCRLCLEKGHNMRTCPIRKLSVEQWLWNLVITDTKCLLSYCQEISQRKTRWHRWDQLTKDVLLEMNWRV